MSSRKKLINNLKNGTYCRLKPDSFGGVGVFAIKDIPPNVNPFVYGTGVCPIKTIDIPDSVVKKFDPEVQRMMNDFYSIDSDGMWGVPKLGLNGNDISFYINTSDTPNIRIVSSRKCDLYTFKTMRAIKKGEELFIDYNLYK
jgi:hypothetical protein